MKNLLPLFIGLLFLGHSNLAFGQKDKRTPFSKVMYKELHPYIEVDSQWVKLMAIEDRPIIDFIEKAVDFEPTNWKRGFHRYLHYLMDDMNMKRDETIQISYEANNKIVTTAFPLDKKNRNLASAYYQATRSKNKIQREHAKEIPSSLNYLIKRIDRQTPTTDWLTSTQAIHDLEYLEWEITNHYSYANLTGFDYKLALDAIRNHLGNGISRRDFAYQLKMFMANFGDGHSSLSFSRYVLSKEEYKWLPFKIIKHENLFYAVNTQDKTYFNISFPQITKINNIDINQLFELAKEMVPKSTTKLVERDAIHYLRFTAFLLKIAGEKNLDKVEVNFSDGKKNEMKTFQLDRYPMSRLLETHRLRDSTIDNIGYLQFNDKMFGDDEFIDSLHLIMQKFKNTDGLIIDIRRNGGGSRDPLKTLLPYFITEPKVTNVARFRINKDKDLKPRFGYLLRRSSFPLDININDFSNEEDRKDFITFKETASLFKNDFNPSKVVSNNKFTDYHFMVVNPSKQSGTYYYDKSVIVLIDEGCFSASDIFAAGIRQGDKITLLGNTTGGGSGFTQKKQLPHSKFKIRLSQMFSYQPNGNLYDGHGVIPDIEVDYTLEDKKGRSDSQLERAIELIKSKQQLQGAK